jgi:hypothetical protein
MGATMRFEGETITGVTTLLLAPDEGDGRCVVVERGLHSERLRQLQRVPYSASVAPLERRRDGHRLRLVHPAPLVLVPPVDEFDVAQAIGSLLDGLAWMHSHGVAHGAVGAASLVEGPTGGRLSLAGACSHTGTASPADDVHAAAALAFTLLFAEPPGTDAHRDPRLSGCSSPAVAEAIRQGLDPDAQRRPCASSLASMVRGEQWLSIWDESSRAPLFGRWRTSVTNAARAFDRRWASVAAGAAALLALAGGFRAADHGAGTNLAATTPLAEFLPPSANARADAVRVVPTTVAAPAAPPSTAAPAPPTTAPASPEVSVLSASAAAPATIAPAPPAPAAPGAPTAPPAPPSTPPPAPSPAPTTPVVTTTRPATTTRAATTTTRSNPGKGSGKGKQANG